MPCLSEDGQSHVYYVMLGEWLEATLFPLYGARCVRAPHPLLHSCAAPHGTPSWHQRTSPALSVHSRYGEPTAAGLASALPTDGQTDGQTAFLCGTHASAPLWPTS